METMHNHVTAAKAIKEALTKLWPSVKFSVVSDSFANGNSIDIYWNFGPTTEQVERIAKKYEYGRFDSMTDCSYTEDTVVLTEGNEFKRLGGAKFVMCQRSYKSALVSEQEFKERFCRDLCTLQKVEYKGEDTDIFGSDKWNPDGAASYYLWRMFCETDFTDRMYAGVEFDEAENRVNFCKIKTRPMTEADRMAEEQAAEAKKAVSNTQKAAENAKKEAVRKEIKEYFIKAMTENPDKPYSSIGFTNWYKAQMAGRILSQLEKEGFAKMAWVSSNGKKVYKKA